MFGWDYHNSKADRIKLFLFILCIFLVVGFTFATVFSAMNNGEEKKEEKETEQAAGPDEKDPAATTENEEENPYDQEEHFSEKELEESQKVAVEFSKAFHNYNSDEPASYLENAKPYMTDALYDKQKKAIRRETLERAYLTAETTDVTQVSNTSMNVVRWNVMIRGTAKSVDGQTTETEDWYLVSLLFLDGEWKVEDVRVNVPN